MKFCLIFAITFGVGAGAEDITPRVGFIQVYGVHKLSGGKVQASLGIKPGDPLPSRLASEERIDKLSGVVHSRVSVFCCDGRQTVLYVGVEEKNAPHAEFHQTPAGTVSLSPDIADKYQALLDSTAESLRASNADEDLTNGYSLMTDPRCRDVQVSLLPLVSDNLAGVDQVVRQSADPEQRAAAAYVLQYAPRTPRALQTAADALQYALQDPDDDVRKNAMMSLNALMIGARLHPEQEVRIEPTWFVELMNSVVWSDRHNASLALLTLTDNGDEATLQLLRERALPSVIDMAQWYDLDHALPGFMLAGRLAGMSDEEIKAAWSNGGRGEVLKRALKPKPKKKTS